MNALSWFDGGATCRTSTGLCACPACHVVVPEPFKACGCGRHFTRAEWDAIPSLGLMLSDRDGFELNLKNCACGSTISVEQPIPPYVKPPQYAPEGASDEEERRCAAEVAKWRAGRVR